MATAAQLKEALIRNEHKRDTPEYAEVYEQYTRKKRREAARGREETGFLDQIEEFGKGIPAGIIGLGELGALGAATLLDEEDELKVRRGIQSVAESLKSPFAADKGSEELVGRKFGEALGSFAGLGLTSLIPGAGVPAAAGLAMGAGAGEASERARAAGATEKERGRAALKGTVVGATELIPLGKLRSLRSSLGDNAFLNGIERIKRAAIAGGYEGAQEAAAGVLQNAIQRGYDPTQDLFNVDVAEEGGYGAAVGATVQALLDLAVPGSRKRGTTGAELTSEQQAGFEEELLAYDDDAEGAPLTKKKEKKAGQVVGAGRFEEEKDSLTEEQRAAVNEADKLAAEEQREKRAELNKQAVAAAEKEVAAGSEFTLEELVAINQRLLGIPVSGDIAQTVRIQDEIKRRQATPVTEGQVVADKAKVDTEAYKKAAAEFNAKKAEKRKKDKGKEKPWQSKFDLDDPFLNVYTRGQVAALKVIDPRLVDYLTQYSNFKYATRETDEADGGEVFLKSVIDAGEISQKDADAIRIADEKVRSPEGVATEEVGTEGQVDTKGQIVAEAGRAIGGDPLQYHLTEYYDALRNDPGGGGAFLKNLIDTGEISSEDADVIRNAYRAQQGEEGVGTKGTKGTKGTGTTGAKKQVATAEQLEEKVINSAVNIEAKALKEGRKNLSEISRGLDTLDGYISIDPTLSIDPSRIPAVKEEILRRLEELEVTEVKAAPLTKKKGKESGAQDRIKKGRKKLAAKNARIKSPSERLLTRFDIKEYASEGDKAQAEKVKAAKGTVASNTEDLGEGYQHAATYFNKFDRIEDAVEAIAYDYADKEIAGAKTFRSDPDDPMPEQAKTMMQGTGGDFAEAAYKWIQNKSEDKGMSEEVQKVATRAFEAYKTNIQDVIDARKETEAQTKLEQKKKEFGDNYIQNRKRKRVKKGKKEVKVWVEGDVTPKTFFKKAKAQGLEFSTEEKKALDLDREQFLKTQEATAKQRAAEDVDRTASDVTTIGTEDLPEGEVISEGESFVQEIQKEAATREAFRNTVLTDAEKAKLENVTAKLTEAEKELDTIDPDKKVKKGKKTVSALKLAEAKVESLKQQKISLVAAADKKAEDEYGRLAMQEKLSPEERRRRAELEDWVWDAETVSSFMPHPLAAESLSELAQPVNKTTAASLASNDLEGALLNISKASGDKHIKSISKKFAGLTGDTQVKIIEDLRDNNNKRLAGVFDPKINTIELDSVLGLNDHTVIHEMAHALGSAQLDIKGSSFTGAITKIYEDTKGLISNPEAVKSVHEFFSESQSNQEFRMELARINPNGSPRSALARIIAAVKKFLISKLGLKIPGQSSSALMEIDALVDNLISPAPMSRNAERLAMSADVRGVEKVANGFGRLWRAVSSPPTNSDRRKFMDGSIQFLSDAKRFVKQTFLGAVDLPGIAEISKKDFGSIGERLNIISHEQRGAMELADKQADAVANVLIRFRDKYGDAAYERLADIIAGLEYGATIHQLNPLFSRTKAKKEYNKEEFERWEELKGHWDALNKDSKGESEKAYRILRNFYKKQYKELKDTVYNRLRKVATEEELKPIQSEVLDLLFADKVLDVYFPLARKGRFKVAYSLLSTPARPLGGEKLSDSYVMEMVNTEAEAERMVADLKKEGNLVGEPDIIDMEDIQRGGYQSTPLRTIEEILRTVDKKLVPAAPMTKQEEAIREDVRAKIIEVFVESLPETSYAKSLASRQNIMGYEKDPLFALQTKGYDLGRQVVRIQYTKKVNDLESELIERYKANRTKLSGAAPALYEELMERAAFTRNPPADLLWQTLNQGAFVYTIGFNASSAIVNLSQIPLFTYPHLAGEYQNNTAAFNEVMKASGFVSSSFSNYDVGIDNYYTVDTKGNYKVNRGKLKELTEGMTAKEAKQKEKELTRLTPLVQLASKRGSLTKSFIMDELSLQRQAFKSGRERSGNIFRQALDKITGVSAMAFNVAERFNRQTTMVAAYNLELGRISNGKDNYTFTEEQLAEAADKALTITQETNGGAFREVGPRLSQQGWKRVALMYKGYGLRMYQTMIKASITAIKGTTFSSDPKENARMRRVAIRQLIGWHLSSLFFAGVYGIPLYGAVTLAADLFLDDEEDDADTIVRKYLGEMPYKGVVNEILGVDVASRIRLTGLLIQSNKYNSNASAEETIGFYLGGPAISTANRFRRGVVDLSEGRIERGIEKMLPAGISNFIKASPMGRVYREGYTTQRGDPIYDDVTTGELAGQLFGFAPIEYTRRIEENLNVKRIDTKIRKRRSKILKRLYIGLSTQNRAEQMAAKRDIAEFNKRHPLFRISATSVSRSMKAHQRTSATMHNGVQLSPQMRTILRQMREGEG